MGVVLAGKRTQQRLGQAEVGKRKVGHFKSSNMRKAARESATGHGMLPSSTHIWRER